MSRILLKLAYVGAAVGMSVIIGRLVSSGKTRELDHNITRRLQQVRSPWFRSVMHAVSWPGFPPQSKILPALIPTAMLSAGRPTEALFQLLGWGTGGISGLVKLFAKRPRPNHPEINVAEARIGGTSFPSGHVIIYTGVYGFLAYLAHLHISVRRLRRLMVTGITLMIALVGPSRVYLGHHWATDVIVSYLLGSSYLVVLTTLYNRARRRGSQS